MLPSAIDRNHLDSVELPLVSVIMPCYNVEPFVRMALESTINQTYKNLEILLIDDGSSDATCSILSEMTLKDFRIKLTRHTVNKGIVATLNEGIENCKGEYITYMHADDISSPNRIEQLMKFILQHSKTDLVAAGYCWLDEKGRVSAPIIPKATLPKSIKFTVFLLTPMPHPLVLGKASVFRGLLYDPDYQYSEDYDLLSRASLNNLVLRNLDFSLYFIRLNDMRLSYRFEKLQNLNHVRISFRNIKYYFGLSVNPLIHQIAVNRMDKCPEPGQIVQAFKLIDILKIKFLQSEHCSHAEQTEIEKVVQEQKIDVLIQSIKFYGWTQSYKLLPMMYELLKLIFYKNGLDYLFRKIHWKFRFLQA